MPLALLLFLAIPANAELTVEYLAQYVIPPGLRFEGACVGGLSAIDYDAAGGRYFALSDDRGEARFFTLTIDFGADASGRPMISSVAFQSVVELLTREGQPYPEGRVDPEGFVLAGGGAAWVSSEGAAELGVPPFVDRVDVASGRFLSSVPIPAAYRPWHDGDVQVRGVRPNLGFESLAISADRRQLYVATESALAQDAERVAAGVTLFARLLHYRLEQEVPRLEAEYLYPLVQPPGDVVVHGLVELQALGNDGRFLAMERTYARDAGMAVQLFEVRLDRTAGADRSSLGPAARSLPALAKRPVLAFGELPIVVDNLEGLTLGPELPDGSASLLVLSDNNNTECAPARDLSGLLPSRLLLFRLRD